MLSKRLKYIYVINIQKLAEQILRNNIILYNDKKRQIKEQ